MNNSETQTSVESIAVVSMSGRFPGARNLDEFWNNLRSGAETISRFSETELRAAGIEPAIAKIPGFVNAGSVLTDIDQFDALFFGYSARDAESIDPQQRLFLECAWECLEGAGYDPETYPGLIGVFGGSDMSTYIYQVYAHGDPLAAGYGGMTLIGNDKDYLTTQVSYKLNLKGPSMAVQTSCSTSLVAVCIACQSLWSYACDMALAGGVAVSVPQKKGYFYQPGGILSPDGHCRTFDAEGQGTVVGNGVGIVLLKRLSDAINDGDTIRAVIRGAALNNDGSLKVGYTAPSISGQAQVIAMTQAMAGVEPDTISYVEAHGTATLLGDPIEVAALTQAFRARTDKKQFCALGSVKSNVGHLASAAGITGLIKTVLALEHRQLPPSINFTTPNPQIDFASSPFFVNDSLRAWETDGAPRRAGVSSFGVGGTNAHVVLEEAPQLGSPGPSRAYHLLTLSAKTATALQTATENLATHLQAHPELNRADVAYTLAMRRAFPHRRVMITTDADADAVVTAVARGDVNRSLTGVAEAKDRPVVFMFSGQGAQHVDMGVELYRLEPTFRAAIDDCCDALVPLLGFDLRVVIYPSSDKREEAAARLQRTALTQPVLFAVEYALARWWMSCGIEPNGMIGHSIGELVAACLAGVFDLDDALRIVVERARLMDAMPTGRMLAAPVSEMEAHRFLDGDISLAAVNAPRLCVFSGPADAIAGLARELAAQGLEGRELHTSHAFHSRMMDPAVSHFVEQLRLVPRRPPKIPFLSNLTGSWITPELATDPNSWGRHLRETVRFADGLGEVMKYPEVILLEVGPGQTLATLARQQATPGARHVILSSLPAPQAKQSDEACLLGALGAAWLSGASVNWSAFYAHEQRRRVPLPTYPFQRQRYWIGQVEDDIAAASQREPEARDVTNWFYVPRWESRTAVPAAAPLEPRRALVFSDGGKLAADTIELLARAGHEVWTVTAGPQFSCDPHARSGTLRADVRSDYELLIEQMRVTSGPPDDVVHLWNTAASSEADAAADAFDKHQRVGFHSLVCLAQALDKANVTSPVQVVVASTGLHAVVDGDAVCPAKSTLLGPCKVLPQEYPNLRCKSVDLMDTDAADAASLVIQELNVTEFEPVVAWRKGLRFAQQFVSRPLAEPADATTRLRHGGVYLITGGLGNIGLELARAICQRVPAKLALLGRSAFPDRALWDARLASHGDDDINRKIRRLIALEEQGADIQILRADSADLAQMREAFARVEDRFGGINGVIHGAGNTSSAEAFAAASHTDRSTADQHFRPKAGGLFTLDELLRGRQLDFVLLLSSLSSILGGLGLLSYAAGNIFLDAFAAHRNRRGQEPWIAVNWDAWQFPGQEGLFQQSAPQGADFLYPAEGAACFHRILAEAPGQVVVSTTDLQVRLNKWIQLESVHAKGAATEVRSGSLHPRPDLSSQFVEPRTDTERTIATVWQDILGVTPIGVHDKFFELGGHSLLAIQLISRLRDAFQIELSPQRLFEAPTIAQLASTIEGGVQAMRHAQAEEDARTEEMLKMVEQLSEEEVAALLAQQEGSPGTGVFNA